MKTFIVRYLPIAMVFGALAFLAGCAAATDAISTKAKPDKKAAILYGRVHIGHQYAIEDHLVLWVKNLESHKQIYIYFNPDRPVYGVSVSPGRYQVTGFLGVNRTHAIEGRRTFHPSLFTQAFEAAPGSEIYLGDFFGSATYDDTMAEWRVDYMTNNFVGTTEEFHDKYPNLIRVPTTPWLQAERDRWNLERTDISH
jgi:hypothetical protein